MEPNIPQTQKTQTQVAWVKSLQSSNTVSGGVSKKDFRDKSSNVVWATTSWATRLQSSIQRHMEASLSCQISRQTSEETSRCSSTERSYLTQTWLRTTCPATKKSQFCLKGRKKTSKLSWKTLRLTWNSSLILQTKSTERPTTSTWGILLIKIRTQIHQTRSGSAKSTKQRHWRKESSWIWI